MTGKEVLTVLVLASGCGSRSTLYAGLLDETSGADAASEAAPPPCDGGCTIAFASGPKWPAYSATLSANPPAFALGGALGLARDVCPSADSPPNCPTGAFLYDFGPAMGGPDWTGGAGMPGAYWIWRPDVSLTATASLQIAAFARSFVVGPGPSGSIEVSADDFAAVFVNGAPAGMVGSVTDIQVALQTHLNATAFDLTADLRSGTNTITVVGQNGPYDCTADAGCPYSRNPAGVAFAGTLRW